MSQNLYKLFQNLDRDRSGTIDSIELHEFLCNEFQMYFHPKTVNLVIGMFKPEHIKGISFPQFQNFYDFIYRWKTAFHALDFDNSGTIGLNELTQSLRGYGFEFHPQLITLILKKYDLHHNGSLLFDEFLFCLCAIKLLQSSYQRIRQMKQQPHDDKTRSIWTYQEFVDFQIENAPIIYSQFLPDKQQ